MDGRSALSCLIVALGVLAPRLTRAAEPEAPPASAWRLAARGGWWDVGADVTTPQGIFLSVGVPWVLYLPAWNYGGQDGLVAADVAVGYRHLLSDRTSLQAKLLTVWSYDWGDPCGDGCTVHTHRLFFFPVVGIRHRLGSTDGHVRTSGPIVGLDLALAVWSIHRSDDDPDPGWRLKRIPVWAGVAFSQVYAGYEW